MNQSAFCRVSSLIVFHQESREDVFTGEIKDKLLAAIVVSQKKPGD